MKPGKILLSGVSTQRYGKNCNFSSGSARPGMRKSAKHPELFTFAANLARGMLLFRQTEKLQTYLRRSKKAGQTVGFVPTMGALHEGHLSLIQASLSANIMTVCSIFVNPTQFNDPEDLRQYPRQLTEDASLLEEAGCQVLFCPSVSEIYPEGAENANFPELDLESLDSRMEGAHRPGHFQGVVQVVHRLLKIVEPDRLYMGQKDFQQVTIIRHMIDKLSLPVMLIIGPTIREKNGLAMSSRNARLSDSARKAAPAIYQTLLQAKKQFGTIPIPEIRRQALEQLDQSPLRPEYFEIVDAHTLLPVNAPDQSSEIIACTAVWAGEVRLIDNLPIKTASNWNHLP